MTFTSHGHQIPGTTTEPRPASMLVARCGGPSFCKQCGVEVNRHSAKTLTDPPRSPFDHDEVDLRQPNFD